MTSKSSFFWTDLQQAQDRLSGSVVLYNDLPVYINSIDGHEDGVPRAFITPCGPDGRGNETRKRLDSPKFARFRKLPNLGWANVMGEKPYATYLQRNNRNSRSHGLSNNTVSCVSPTFSPDNAYFSIDTRSSTMFDSFMYNDGFIALHKGQYPSLEKTLEAIVEMRSIAFSPNFACIRDRNGVRWLYRKDEAIGIFTGVDSLLLFSSKTYLREEIMADPLFTINTIREF